MVYEAIKRLRLADPYEFFLKPGSSRSYFWRFKPGAELSLSVTDFFVDKLREAA